MTNLEVFSRLAQVISKELETMELVEKNEQVEKNKEQVKLLVEQSKRDDLSKDDRDALNKRLIELCNEGYMSLDDLNKFFMDQIKAEGCKNDCPCKQDS